MKLPKANTFPLSTLRERSMGPSPLELCEELLGCAVILMRPSMRWPPSYSKTTNPKRRELHAKGKECSTKISKSKEWVLLLAQIQRKRSRLTP